MDINIKRVLDFMQDEFMGIMGWLDFDEMQSIKYIINNVSVRIVSVI